MIYSWVNHWIQSMQLWRPSVSTSGSVPYFLHTLLHMCVSPPQCPTLGIYHLANSDCIHFADVYLLIRQDIFHWNFDDNYIKF